MKRTLTLMCLLVVIPVLVGCRSTQPPGIATEAERIHTGLLQLADSMNRTDPNRQKVLDLADEAGTHKKRCRRVQEHWEQTDDEIRNLLNGSNP